MIEQLQKVAYFPDVHVQRKIDIVIESIARQLREHPEGHDAEG